MKKALIILLLMVGIGTTITAQIRTVNIPSDHLIITGNVLTVKNWGPKFDGDYDMAKLATDSCVSGNCVDGNGRKILISLISNIPSIRIMEGKFKHDAFIGHGVMLVDGEGAWYDGTYEIGKYKFDYKTNGLYAKATFLPKDLNETIEGHFDGYLDGGIGSALPEYRKFVVCRFRPLYESKKATVWEKAIYPLERDAELKVIFASAEYIEGQAKVKALQGSNNNNQTPTQTNQPKGEKIKTMCFECHGSGKTFRTEFSYYEQYGKQYRKETKVYSTCYKCQGAGKY